MDTQIQLKAYYDKFRTRLSPRHALHLKRLVLFISALTDFCKRFGNSAVDSPASGPNQNSPSIKARVEPAETAVNGGSVGSEGTAMMTVGELVSQLGQKVDGFNLLEVVQYLRESKIARKVGTIFESFSGFPLLTNQTAFIGFHHRSQATAITLCSKSSQGRLPMVRRTFGYSGIPRFNINCSSWTASQVGENSRRMLTPPLHAVEAFLLALVDPSTHGRIFVERTFPTHSASLPAKFDANATFAPVVTLKYQLLNPEEAFRDVVQDARAVILAGGTMTPVRYHINICIL
jgi:chromosome transmission fidelity protein 1